jgi:iron complex transport system substrate-binding protein
VFNDRVIQLWNLKLSFGVHSHKMRNFVIAVGVLLGLVVLVHFVRTPPPLPEQRTGERVVSLAPNLTGLIWELGAGKNLVGVTTYCDYPQQVAEIDKIGDFLNPNLEKIVSLDPSLILAEQWASSRTVPRLKQLGFHVLDFPTPRSLNDIYKLINRVGSELDRETEADLLTTDMRRRVEQIENRATLLPATPLLYLEIDLPTWTVGKASFTNEAIARCGARNVFDDLLAPAPQVSEEAIIGRNPDIIVSFASSAQEIAARPGWDRISAVQNGRIIDDFSQALLSRGNHRIVEGMELLQSRIFEVMGLED